MNTRCPTRLLNLSCVRVSIVFQPSTINCAQGCHTLIAFILYLLSQPLNFLSSQLLISLSPPSSIHPAHSRTPHYRRRSSARYKARPGYPSAIPRNTHNKRISAPSSAFRKHTSCLQNS